MWGRGGGSRVSNLMIVFYLDSLLNRFIYTDDYSDSWPDVLELFEASVKFEVEDLEILLEEVKLKIRIMISS